MRPVSERWSVVALLGLMSTAAVLPSQAAEPPGGCGAKRLGSAAVATLENVPIITLKANNRPATLILDTGAELTTLTPAAAQRIGAQPPRIEINHLLRGIGGTLATREIELTSFAVGDVPLLWHRVLVAPITIATAGPAPLDGLLGADELSDFDIDLDLPHHRITFYEKQTCATAAPDLRVGAWAGAYSTIIASRSASDHLFFPVTVDGRTVTAIIDTGAQRTTVSTAMVRALGVSDAALALGRPVTARGATGEQLSSHIHRFSSLTVGGETARDPELVVTDLTLQDADIVLGADFLGSRHLWLSYGSRRVFLSRP